MSGCRTSPTTTRRRRSSRSLANTLFFSAASAESKDKVALYLLITVAPFALVAPLIGPMLDRIQRGRRLALAGSTAAQGALAVVLALSLDTWALYPAALGIMVLSKSFGVLKAAVTPRVLPAGITLVTTSSALGKVCLDAVLQRDMPEASRASAFGRSETIRQLACVFGGALGVLLPPTWWIGFTVIGAVLALGTVQTVMASRGTTLIPMPRRADPA